MKALRLGMTDFLGSRELYRVVRQADSVKLTYTVDPSSTEGTIENELTGTDAEAFFNRLATFDFASWRVLGEPQPPLLADTRWNLAITEDDERVLRYEGGQPFPDRFNELLSLLKYTVTVPGGHFLPPIAWQLDYVRFGTLQLPKFEGPRRFLSRQLRYRRTYLIEANENRVVLRTQYAEPLSDHDVVYHDPKLVAALASKVAAAVAELGEVADLSIDSTWQPRSVLALTIQYPHGEPTRIQVDAELNRTMKMLWQTVTEAIQAFQRSSEHRDQQDAIQLGPQLMHYIKVNFRHGVKDYLYKTDIPSLQEGDLVLVPVGNEGRTLHAEVTNPYVMPPIHFPVPPDKIKQVIGLADLDDDEDEDEDDWC